MDNLARDKGKKLDNGEKGRMRKLRKDERYKKRG
jgi:hypothetical protein